MDSRPTDELNKLLEQADPRKFSAYLKENRDSLANGDRPFYHYMKETLRNKGILMKDMYSFAGLSEKYGSSLVAMEKHTTNRDVILRLCIAGHFTVEEASRALKLYGMSPLYSKNARDACIMICMHHRKYDLGELDDSLAENGFPILSVEESK